MHYKKYFFIALSFLLIDQSTQGMEEQKRPMPALVADDSAILPITVNLVDEDNNIVHSTQFSPGQLQFLGTLHSQYGIDKDNPLVIPQEHISEDNFATVEKISMLLDVFAPSGENEQKKELVKCFRASDLSDRTFVEVLNTANYLNIPLLHEVCIEQLYTRARLLYATNADQAVALLKKVKATELSVGIGNHILEHSRFLKQLLISVSNKAKKVPEASVGFKTNSLCYVPNKASLLCGLSNGTIALLHSNEYRSLGIKASTAISSIVFSKANTLHFCCNNDHHVQTHCLDRADKTELRIRRPPSCTPILNTSPEHCFLCTAFDTRAVVWDAAAGNKVVEYTHPYTINALDFDHKKKYLYLGCDNCIDIYDIENKKMVQTFFTGFKKVTALCLSKDRKMLFCGDNGLNTYIWDIEKETHIQSTELEHTDSDGDSHIFDIDQLKLSPDGTMLAVAFRKIPNFMKLLDAQDLYCVKSFDNGSGNCMDFSSDGSTLAAVGNNCILFNKLYDPRLLKRLRKLPAPHIAVLDYCAHALRNDQPIDLSEQNQALFDQLPKQIKDYFEQIKKNNKK